LGAGSEREGPCHLHEQKRTGAVQVAVAGTWRAVKGTLALRNLQRDGSPSLGGCEGLPVAPTVPGARLECVHAVQ
jgi:hypothetical protein